MLNCRGTLIFWTEIFLGKTGAAAQNELSAEAPSAFHQDIEFET
jgi:hypothetical protein